MLNDNWVDLLFHAELEIIDEDGTSCLLYFMLAKNLDNFDFTCKRFLFLLQK